MSRTDAGAIDEREWICVRADGTRFPIRLAVTALRDTGNILLGYLFLGTDVHQAWVHAAGMDD